MNNNQIHIRKAEIRDASRLAEILVFSKRTHYRSIFHNDEFSFGELQVLPAALNFTADPEALMGYYVYDDGFVKGLIHLQKEEISELYVDPFFEYTGIGSSLISFALERIHQPELWVLEENDQAIRFYQSKGFSFTGKRRFVPGTEKYEAFMRYNGPFQDDIAKNRSCKH